MDNQEDIKKINSVGLFALIIGAIGVSVAGFGFYQGLTSEDARPLLSWLIGCLLYTSPSPRDEALSRMPSSA